MESTITLTRSVFALFSCPTYSAAGTTSPSLQARSPDLVQGLAGCGGRGWQLEGLTYLWLVGR